MKTGWKIFFGVLGVGVGYVIIKRVFFKSDKSKSLFGGKGFLGDNQFLSSLSDGITQPLSNPLSNPFSLTGITGSLPGAFGGNDILGLGVLSSTSSKKSRPAPQRVVQRAIRPDKVLKDITKMSW